MTAKRWGCAEGAWRGRMPPHGRARLRASKTFGGGGCWRCVVHRVGGTTTGIDLHYRIITTGARPGGGEKTRFTGGMSQVPALEIATGHAWGSPPDMRGKVRLPRNRDRHRTCVEKSGYQQPAPQTARHPRAGLAREVYGSRGRTDGRQGFRMSPPPPSPRLASTSPTWMCG